MDGAYVDLVFAKFRENGVAVEPGLSDMEVDAIEKTYRFSFPADLRQFLQCGLPVSREFPDWRSGTREEIQTRLDWPLYGILFDIEHNVFWLSEWGGRPADLAEAKRIVAVNVRQAPILIPIYSHRFLPSEPCLPGNPVYSVYQTDIIYYGYDLSDYFRREFEVSLPERAAARPREIRFWSKLVS
jgi:hypothetical protein